MVWGSALISVRNKIDLFKFWKLLFVLLTALLTIEVFSKSFIKLVIIWFIVYILHLFFLNNFIILLLRFSRLLFLRFTEEFQKSASLLVLLLFCDLFIFCIWLLNFSFRFFTLIFLFFFLNFLCGFLWMSTSWPFPKNLHQWISLLLFFTRCCEILGILQRLWTLLWYAQTI